MATNNQRVAIKTALLGPGATLVAWGVQMLINGNPTTGAAGVAVGIAFFAGYVLLQEYDLPYEDEIRSLIAETDTEAATEVGKDAAEAVSDRLSAEQDDGSNRGGEG